MLTARRVLAVTACVLTAGTIAGVVVSLAAGTRRAAAPAPATAGRASAAAARRGGCPGRFGTFRAGNWPPACWRPYGPASPFNRQIPANPRLAGESAGIVSYMRSVGWTLQTDGSRNFTIDNGGSRPVYWAQSSDPLIRVNCRGGYSCKRGMTLRIPAGARPEAQSDGHMTVVDQQHGLEYDFWQATTPSNGTMTVSAGGSIPIGPDRGTGLGGVAEAADLGLLGGLLRAPELAARRIEHALITTVPCVQSRDVWPSPSSGRGDSVCARGGLAPHFGSLLQLDMSEAEIAATHAPSWQRALMTAMAKYGIYVVDTNGPSNPEMSLLTEDDQSFESFGRPGQMHSLLQRISGGEQAAGVPIDLSRLRVIAPCVPRGTC